jgi:hypothetical protein
MKRSFENSIELSRKIANDLPDLEISFEQIRKDEKLYNKAKELERHLIEAHDLLWDLKLALIGVPGKIPIATPGKKRRGRPPKKKQVDSI